MDAWRRHVRSRLGSLDIAPEREAEIVEELAQQLEATYSAAVEAGAGETEARARAEAEVGDWQELARTLRGIERPVAARLPAAVRPAAGAPPLGDAERGLRRLAHDLRQAVRTLRRAPGFAAAAVAILAFGLGATTLVYTLVDQVLLRPLPIAASDRVVLAYERDPDGARLSFA